MDGGGDTRWTEDEVGSELKPRQWETLGGWHRCGRGQVTGMASPPRAQREPHSGDHEDTNRPSPLVFCFCGG